MSHTIKFIYFKMFYRSVNFSKFIQLGNHHNNPICEHFHPHTKFLYGHLQLIPCPLSALQDHLLTFCLYNLVFCRFLRYKCIHIIFVGTIHPIAYATRSFPFPFEQYLIVHVYNILRSLFTRWTSALFSVLGYHE